MGWLGVIVQVGGVDSSNDVGGAKGKVKRGVGAIGSGKRAFRVLIASDITDKLLLLESAKRCRV
jgi:hypothetical protein